MKRLRAGELSGLVNAVFTLIFAGVAMAQLPQPLNRPALPPTYRPGSYGPTVAIPAGPQPALSSSSWTPLGPASLSTEAGNVSGRIAGVAVDPTNSSNIYIAAAGGGVWQSTDAGVTWNALTDSQSTLAMGAIAIAPSNHLRIYAGTGEANNSAD